VLLHFASVTCAFDPKYDQQEQDRNAYTSKSQQHPSVPPTLSWYQIPRGDRKIRNFRCISLWSQNWSYFRLVEYSPEKVTLYHFHGRHLPAGGLDLHPARVVHTSSSRSNGSKLSCRGRHLFNDLQIKPGWERFGSSSLLNSPDLR